MKGLLQKIWLETRLSLVCFSIGLAVIMALLGALLPRVLENVDQFFNTLPFIKPLISALLGMDISNGFTNDMMQAFLWVHPTVLSLIWAHELMFCSRIPAGEIDRGTVDFLLSLPVSRWKLYLAETIGWLCTGVVVIAVGLLGLAYAATTFETDMRPRTFALACILCNLLAMYVAVGGLTFLVSACSDRRGRAIGVMFAVLLISFLLNFLAPIMDAVQSRQLALEGVVEPETATDSTWQVIARVLSNFSVLEYYRPAEAIQSQQFPLTEIAILLAIGCGSWLLAGGIFSRRSICTV